MPQVDPAFYQTPLCSQERGHSECSFGVSPPEMVYAISPL
jgi:hypothetical protein